MMDRRTAMVWVRRLVFAEVVVYALKVNLVGAVFTALKNGAEQVLRYSSTGAAFVFGVFGSEEGRGSGRKRKPRPLIAPVTLTML